MSQHEIIAVLGASIEIVVSSRASSHTANSGSIDEHFGAISGPTLPRDAARLAEISGFYGHAFLPPDGTMVTQRRRG